MRLNQPNQLPDYLAYVEVRPTGLFDLNGKNETIGVADVQNALYLQAGSTVNLGTATLSLNGNLGASARQRRQPVDAGRRARGSSAAR